MDDRIKGILSLVAERFGGTEASGWQMLDVRLTHQNLAEAVCATRPTVTKALLEMESRDVVRFEGAGDYRRMFLRPDSIQGPRREP